MPQTFLNVSEIFPKGPFTSACSVAGGHRGPDGASPREDLILSQPASPKSMSTAVPSGRTR